MSQGLDDSGPTGRPRGWPALPRESGRYTLAVLGYIALILLTKDYLTFTWGVFYFVFVLEVLPRCYRRIRGRGSEPKRPAVSGMTES